MGVLDLMEVSIAIARVVCWTEIPHREEWSRRSGRSGGCLRHVLSAGERIARGGRLEITTPATLHLSFLLRICSRKGPARSF